jgi:hypothetical protein
MKVVILIAGVGCLLGGLLAIGFGIPVKEFSFGNTLILAGSVGACTGLVMLALWAVVRELQGLAERLGPGLPLDQGMTELQPSIMPVMQRSQPAEKDSVPAGRDQSPAEQIGRAEPGFQSAALSQHELPPFPEPVEPPPAPKPRRNLMFSSSSRRERERAQAHAADQSAAHAAVAPPVPEPSEPALGSLDERPRAERARPAAAAPQRRSGRAPSTFDEPYEHSAGGSESQPPVTVLKSGVVDGMAYSLYSDGSIEAQMPEGMMRFASIDELRAHLDQRP